MTVEQLAAAKINDAVERLRARLAQDMLTAPLTPEGDELRRLHAIKAQVAQDVAIQITLEINR